MERDDVAADEVLGVQHLESVRAEAENRRGAATEANGILETEGEGLIAEAAGRLADVAIAMGVVFEVER